MNTAPPAPKFQELPLRILFVYFLQLKEPPSTRKGSNASTPGTSSATLYSSLSPGISSPTSQTRHGSRCSGLPSASLSTTPTSCTKCQMPTTSRGTAGLSLERDLSGSCWAWRMHHQPTETVLAQGWQGQGGSLSPACLLEGPCVARGSAFSITP